MVTHTSMPKGWMLVTETLSKKYQYDARESVLNQLLYKRRKPVTEPQKVRWALRNVDLVLKRGDFLAVIGNNGAGKSTLLKILSRVVAPTSGEVKYRGKLASLLEIGTGFHRELTGRENVYLNASILGIRPNEVASALDEIVEFSGIESSIDLPVKYYSSGMYVRLAFSVAAHLKADIILLDEVLAVGDGEFQKKCKVKMENLSKQGHTVVLVSHNMNNILEMCNSAILLSDGEIATAGKPAEVIRQYWNQALVQTETRYVAREKDVDFQILEVVVENRKGNETAVFDVKEAISLRIKYLVKRKLAGTALTIKISTGDTIIGTCFDTDKNRSLLADRREGIHCVRATIPPLTLKPGRYKASIGSGILNQGAIDKAVNAVNFDVESISDSDALDSFSKKRDGLVILPIDFEELPN